MGRNMDARDAVHPDPSMQVVLKHVGLYADKVAHPEFAQTVLITASALHTSGEEQKKNEEHEHEHEQQAVTSDRNMDARDAVHPDPYNWMGCANVSQRSRYIS